MNDYQIKNFLDRYGYDYTEKGRTIRSACPVCGNEDKFSILRANGSTICYRASCSYQKKPFHSWLALVANVTEEIAKKMLYGENFLTSSMDDLDLDPWLGLSVTEENFSAVDYPTAHMCTISTLFDSEPRHYLHSRGLTDSIIQKYDIKYSSMSRRVYFPIYINSVCKGYQGRAIDKVEDRNKVRNNEGFSRERLVMFYDNINPNEHVIMAEGPVDAIKFDMCGGNIATLGKVVTDKQLDLILKKKPKRIYLALDSDAQKETDELIQKLRAYEVYTVSVPQSAIERCLSNGKKADFGECTYEECYQAFQQSTPIRHDELTFKLL